MTFKPGQEVSWSSQANGSDLKKVGTIVRVIPAGVWLKDVLSRDEAKSEFSLRTDFAGLPRQHESYLVAVPGNSDRAKKQLYWPRVSSLKVTGN